MYVCLHDNEKYLTIATTKQRVTFHCDAYTTTSIVLCAWVYIYFMGAQLFADAVVEIKKEM